MTVSSIDAPIVLREQIEADGSISRVEAWLATDGDESQHQIVVSESDTRLSWGGILRLGYDLNGELVRLVVDNYGTEIEGAEAAAPDPPEALRLLRDILGLSAQYRDQRAAVVLGEARRYLAATEEGTP